MMKRLPRIALAAMLAGAALAANVTLGQQDQRRPAPMGRFNGRNINSIGPAPRRVGGSAIHEPFAPPVTADKIRVAIDDAVMYLRGLMQDDGSVGGPYGGSSAQGETALAALTLLASGIDPTADDQLQKCLDYLGKIEPDNTYVRGIRANVWEYALRKNPDDATLQKRLKTDYEWLLAALGEREGWRYAMNSSDWDNSCTQYGVLGVWAAARAGFEPGTKFWQKLSSHFRAHQHPDGGWGYVQGSQESTPNMATAGLASLFLVFDMHHGKSFYSQANPRTFADGDAAAVLSCIQKGMTWLGQAQSDKDDGYYLYGIERTGVASGLKLIGGEDWFARGALAVCSAQRPDGSIPLGRWGGGGVSTCFCTLFLIYGGAPVAFNKLQYGPGHDWNLNPRDLANLSKFLWSAYESPLNWQIVSLDKGPQEIEAPILFISGSQPAAFDDAQVTTLRQYIQRGGTILAEPSDHSAAFCKSAEDLLERMFPKAQYPGWQLKELPADHGVYTVMKQDWKNRPRLRGASDGSRVFFLMSDEYLSADWQMDRTDTDARSLAMNLLFYATDLGSLQGKFASMLPATPAAQERKDKSISIARVCYGGSAGGRGDWDAASQCWQKFAPYVKHLTGAQLKEAEPVTLNTADLHDIRLLHITGHHELVLSPTERAALKAYVENGGTVLVDAYAGSAEFSTSARAVLQDIFGPLQPLPAEHILADGHFKGGQDLSGGIEFKLPVRQLLRSRGQQPQGQKLQVAMKNNRPGVIFSEFDLVSSMAGIANYRALSYQPASARKIIGNLLAYLTME